MTGLLAAPQIRVTARIIRSEFCCGVMGEFQMGALAIKGETVRFMASDSIPLRAGCEVVVSGHRDVHPKHGDQFKVRDVHVVRLPQKAAGVEDFLAAHLGGCGDARAKRIVKTLGTSALETLRENPDLLLELYKGRIGRTLRLGWDDLQKMWAADQRATDLAARLAGAGLTHRSIHTLLRYFRSPELAEVVMLRHPYRLLDVPGFGWKRADGIALKLGVAKDSLERGVAACVVALDGAADDGHSAVQRSDLIRRMTELVGPVCAEAGLVEAEDGAAVIEDEGLYYLPDSLRDEWAVSRSLKARGRMRYELAEDAAARVDTVICSSKLNSEQAEAVRVALTAGAAILTGGPGTGKTTTVKTVVRCAELLGLRVRTAAPTGRAAARASEVTGAPAETVHRLIGGPPGTQAYVPIPADLLIVDETSMVSLDILAWLLKNTSAATRVLFVGDPDQLPSVGHGAVLRDIIESDALPAVQLTQVYRQGKQSGITQAAHSVLAGREPPGNAGEFLWSDITDRRNPRQAPDSDWELARGRERLDDVLQHLGQRAPDAQILTPVRRGPLGVTELNVVLQERLNPQGDPGPKIGGGYRVRLGDRVIQIRNDYTMGDAGVMNGEIGHVLEVGPERAVVRFGEGKVEVTSFRLYSLHLAWATTVHKAQGSEFETVIMLAHRSHGVLLSRQLLYTAITRAAETFILIADQAAVQAAVQNDSRHERRTGLARNLS
jgi:exodeoxyribonuclease V alpha subunit